MFSQLEALKGILDYIPIRLKSTTAIEPIVSNSMSYVIRAAGVSGALAVGLGAYGSHVVLRSPAVPKERKRSFKTSSKYQFIHTLALLASPKARYPHITAALFVGGILLFCGPCYHFALTGIEHTKFVTPYGGVMFILGWLSFIL